MQTHTHARIYTIHIENKEEGRTNGGLKKKKKKGSCSCPLQTEEEGLMGRNNGWRISAQDEEEHSKDKCYLKLDGLLMEGNKVPS